MSNPIYNPVNTLILYRALRIVGAYDPSKTPRTEQVQGALEELNLMLKLWQIDTPLWLRIFVTLFLNEGQQSYQLGPLANGGNHCATTYTQTTLSSGAAQSANSLSLTSGIGSTGDWIGIVDNNGLIEWFNMITAGGTTSINGNLSAAANAGNVVYSHTVASQVNRPCRVFSAVRQLYNPIAAQRISTEIDIISKNEYLYLPNKSVTGKTVQAFYDPQLVAGTLWTWPCADTANDTLYLQIDRPIQAITSTNDTLDVPMEWLDPITFCLAERLWWEYPGNGADYQLLSQRALAAKESVTGFDIDPAPTQMQPDYRS